MAIGDRQRTGAAEFAAGELPLKCLERCPVSGAGLAEFTGNWEE